MRGAGCEVRSTAFEGLKRRLEIGGEALLGRGVGEAVGDRIPRARLQRAIVQPLLFDGLAVSSVNVDLDTPGSSVTSAIGTPYFR